MTRTPNLVAAQSSTGPLPQGKVALGPAEHRGLGRDEIRLLVAGPTGIAHRQFRDLPDSLRSGDLLLMNDSATLPAEIDGWSRAHGPLVVHVGTRPAGVVAVSTGWTGLGADGLEPPDRRGSTGVGLGGLGRRSPVGERRVVELRTAPDASRPLLDAREGEDIQLPGEVRLRLLAHYPRPRSAPSGLGNRLWEAEVQGTGSLDGHLAEHGRPISYGYLAERFPLTDYQTVFAARSGSSEMPSAGRPFTHALVDRLVAGGIGTAAITLHTGLSSQDAGEPPQAEWFDVPAATARLVESTRRAGARVVAVGTTVVRALESAADEGGVVRPRRGWTDLLVTPDRPVRAVDGIVTGWHDSAASHVQLVEAVVGAALVREAYDAAAAQGYLWHEFGDSSLLLRR